MKKTNPTVTVPGGSSGQEDSFIVDNLTPSELDVKTETEFAQHPCLTERTLDR